MDKEQLIKNSHLLEENLASFDVEGKVVDGPPPDRRQVYRETRRSLQDGLDRPFPVPPPREQCYRDGIWESYSRLSHEARSLLTSYVVAFLVDEQPEFLEKAWEGLTSIMNWPSWVHPVHEFMLLDLDSSHTNEMLATAYDLLHDHLTANKRKEMEFLIHARGLSLCLKGMESFGWATMYNSNWCSVCVCNVGMTAIAMLESQHYKREELIPIIQESVERVTRFFDSIEEDEIPAVLF